MTGVPRGTRSSFFFDLSLAVREGETKQRTSSAAAADLSG
jgi:hypothetical protein